MARSSDLAVGIGVSIIAVRKAARAIHVLQIILMQLSSNNTVAIAQLAVDIDHYDAWTTGLDFIIGKLYTNSLLASLNTRKHLRSQPSGAALDLCMSASHFAIPPRSLRSFWGT
ncbi:hypothetical protein F5J12DRAFT_786768 [Pisolithus orientalis]|uniref:uncharacterized protein n=1 Tax=Pisolithus orientalis TaxID=936130 RepID=UPI0022247306|nr:uncharacterized protein F5J12DRAFT_786768 [Pisolithus orientalis]KAI5988869.1 hypothetical protein F5J12DRAFT_786768 [Pisolithus orientalis]